MAFHDPNMDIPITTVDWFLDTDPYLSWELPEEEPDHIRVLRNTTADFSTAADISGSLDGAVNTFSDTTAARDGTAYFWWVIAYSTIFDDLAGANFSVCGWYNNWTRSVEDALSNVELDIPLLPTFGGHWCAEGNLTWASCLTKNGYINDGNPNSPIPDYMYFDIGQNGSIYFIAHGDGPGGYAKVEWAGVGGVGVEGPGGGPTYCVPASANSMNPIPVYATSSGPDELTISINARADAFDAPVPNSNGFNFGTIDGTMVATVSYVSPQGTPDDGQGSIGGGSGSPPGKSKGQLILGFVGA